MLPLLATEHTLEEIGGSLGMEKENAKGQARRLYARFGARTRHGTLVRWLRPDLYPKGRLNQS
jgi:DNA-binding CsgD family transcriptional regulator